MCLNIPANETNFPNNNSPIPNQSNFVFTREFQFKNPIKILKAFEYCLIANKNLIKITSINNLRNAKG